MRRGCGQNKPVVQCPRWPPPAPEPSQRSPKGSPPRSWAVLCLGLGSASGSITARREGMRLWALCRV